MVYTTGNTSKPIEQYDKCDGKGTVAKGVEIFMGGREGKVKM